MGPELMLASKTTLPIGVAVASITATGDWAAELKLDGIRAVVTLAVDGVRITNRNGVDITHRYPDVVKALEALGLVAVLDGEIIVKGPGGRPDFAAVHRRDAQSRPRAAAELARVAPATFVAFDVLSINGIDVRGLPYTSRRERLDRLGGDGALEINPSLDDGVGLWEFVVAKGLEGVVLKRRDSRYVGGRSRAWIKVKAVKRISALVSGSEPGHGHLADTFGALHLALVDEDGQLRQVGSVGTGFTDADRRTIWGRLHRGDHPIIVDVKYLDVSPTSGHLRQPIFQAIRGDIRDTDCTVSQLD